MKKVLLASTALALTAGMAAAEVSLSGYAEIGVAQVDNGDGTQDDLGFHSDIDVTFTLSGETDGGLQFGATIDLDEVGDDATTTTGGLVTGGADPIASDGNPGGATEEHSVFVKGDFGTITMGDTDGAFDWAMTEVWWGSAIADDHTAHAGASGNNELDGSYDGQVARYDYSFGDFAFALSAELDDTGTGDTALGAGIKYSMDLGGTSLGFGVGYQDNGTSDIAGISVDAAFAGGLGARVNYSTGDFDGTAGDDDHMAIGLSYTSGPLLVEANYGEFDRNGTTTDGWGAAVNYDLGGGAVAMVGYGTDDTTDRFSAGLGLSF